MNNQSIPTNPRKGQKKLSLQDALQKVSALINKSILQSDEIARLTMASEDLLLRAEKAENKLNSSETALSALNVLHHNSLENIQIAIEAMDAMGIIIKNKNKDLKSKDKALVLMNKTINRNAHNLKAISQTLNAVNELAYSDWLTGLPNRRLLDDRLKQSVAHNKRWETFSAVIYIDLDKFKLLNDEFGHKVGDALLIAIGHRLGSCVRESDSVARYGGDEFVVLLDRLVGNFPDAKSQADIVARKILSSLAEPFTLPTYPANGIPKNGKNQTSAIEYNCHASLGVVVFGGSEQELKHALDWADEAMYWSKSEGGNTIRFYDEMQSTEQTLHALYNLATENDIETANHGIRTRQYVKTLANRAMYMNIYPELLDARMVERLFKVTQLHDIGKTKVPYSIVHKKGKLTEGEWEIMKQHTNYGAQILQSAKKHNVSLIDFLDTAIEMAQFHHERWDGTGYPLGLAGDEIPLAGRIMAIADVYDSLIMAREYKKAWEHQDVVDEIVSKAGTHFDPSLVQAFLREQETFKNIADSAKD